MRRIAQAVETIGRSQLQKELVLLERDGGTVFDEEALAEVGGGSGGIIVSGEETVAALMTRFQNVLQTHIVARCLLITHPSVPLRAASGVRHHAAVGTRLLIIEIHRAQRMQPAVVVQRERKNALLLRDVGKVAQTGAVAVRAAQQRVALRHKERVDVIDVGDGFEQIGQVGAERVVRLHGLTALHFPAHRHLRLPQVLVALSIDVEHPSNVGQMLAPVLQLHLRHEAHGTKVQRGGECSVVPVGGLTATITVGVGRLTLLIGIGSGGSVGHAVLLAVIVAGVGELISHLQQQFFAEPHLIARIGRSLEALFGTVVGFVAQLVRFGVIAEAQVALGKDVARAVGEGDGSADVQLPLLGKQTPHAQTGIGIHRLLPRGGAIERARGGGAVGIGEVFGGKGLVKRMTGEGVGVAVIDRVALPFRISRFLV